MGHTVVLKMQAHTAIYGLAMSKLISDNDSRIQSNILEYHLQLLQGQIFFFFCHLILCAHLTAIHTHTTIQQFRMHIDGEAHRGTCKNPIC